MCVSLSKGEVQDSTAPEAAILRCWLREIQELPGSTASRRQQFWTASVEWHRFLGFGSSIQAGAQRGVKRPADPF